MVRVRVSPMKKEIHLHLSLLICFLESKFMVKMKSMRLRETRPVNANCYPGFWNQVNKIVNILFGKALNKLAENRQKIIEAQNSVAAIEDEVARLPRLEEQVSQFKSLGLEEKLKIVPFLEMEKRLLKRILEEETTNLNKAFQSVRDSLPDTIFLSESALANLPHAENLGKMRAALDNLRGEAEKLLNQWQEKYENAKVTIEILGQELNAEYSARRRCT